jgi:hypothetical protein
VKKALSSFLLTLAAYYATAQPSSDTAIKLVAQKENIITASTILKIENLGSKVNSQYAELRPTVSADGNLLFFICENNPANTKYRSARQ